MVQAAVAADTEQQCAAGAAACSSPDSVSGGVLLELLLAGNPFQRLLPQLAVPIGYYAVTSDSDVPYERYVQNSKTGRFVSFHAAQGSRYSLLSGQADLSVFSEVVTDQTMLLVALLGDHNIEALQAAAVATGGGLEADAALKSADAAAASQEQVQQQQREQDLLLHLIQHGVAGLDSL